MSTGVEIEIGEIGGPWPNVVIESTEEPNVVRVIAAHFPPRLSLTSHTAKPKVLPGVWELTPDAEHSTGVVQLVARQLEMFSEDFEGIDGTECWGRFHLVVEKPSVGFFQIKGIAIVRDADITLAEQRVKILSELSIVLEAILIARVVRQSLDCDGALVHPTIGERE